MMKYLLILILFYSCGTIRERPEPIPIIDKKDLVYPELLDEKFEPPKDYCFLLQDLKNEKVIEEHNSQKKFMPASTLKLLTGLFSLSVLGENYTFKTRLYMDGTIDKGILRGNLYLKGEGDPLFFTNHMMLLVEALQNRGIEKVIGGFYYDHSNLFSSGYIDSKQNSSLPYNPGIGPLAVEFNRSRFIWERDDEGELKYYSLPVPYFNKINESDHEIEYENQFIYDDSNIWKMSKDSRKSGDTELPVKNPAGHFSLLFHYMAQLRGIMLPFPKYQKMPDSAALLHEIKSPPVSEIVSSMMEYSNNLLAESLLLNAAKVHGPNKSLSLKSSAKLMKDWLIKEVKVNPHEIIVVNGSGLSTKNRISCKAMNSILIYAEKKLKKSRSYLTYLPISGIRGTLYSRLTHPYLALKVWAKTGSMNYASALSGYLLKKGKEYVFTILMNDFNKRKIIDKEPSKRSRENLEANSWRKDAQFAQDVLIQKWVL